MEKKLPDTELVEALQKASQAEVSRLIHSEIAYSSQQRNSVILYEATKALLRFLPGPTTGQDWRHLFEQLANQKCTSISRRLSEIRLYVLNRSTLNVARQFPFIQWSWLDQAPVIPNEILQKLSLIHI